MKKLTCLFAYFCCVATAFAQSPNALFPFPNAEGKWGYVDAQKNVKIAYQFLGASPFYPDEQAPNKKIYVNRQVYLNKQGEIAFELPAMLKGREVKDGDGQVYITSGAGKNFYQGLACWIVQTSDSTVKIVYLTPAGKVAFESGEIKM